MLRLVPPHVEGQESRPSFRRILTKQESSRVRVVMRTLRHGHGGWDVIAQMTGYTVKTLQCAAYHSNRPVSASLALQIAKIAGVPLEHLMSGKPREVGACPTCGRKGAR